MFFLILGTFAFIFFYMFDLNKIFFKNKYLNYLFGIGVIVLVIATVGLLTLDSYAIGIPLIMRLIFGILAVLMFVLLVYTLFFALPFNNTYLKNKDQNKVVDYGMYALCRHPGVIWFFFFYFFLWIASDKIIVLVAAIIWTIMDIIHVYVQDKWIFPRILKNYVEYRLNTPFLLPNIESIRKTLSTL